jgi:hypothetical protein
MKKYRYTYLLSFLLGTALLFSCAKEVPEEPEPDDRQTEEVPEGYARMEFVFRVEKPALPERTVSRAAGPEIVTGTISSGGLSVVRTPADWSTPAPTTRQGELDVENVIHDLWVVQTEGPDKQDYTTDYEYEIIHSTYIDGIEIAPWMNTPIEDPDEVEYADIRLPLTLKEAPGGCRIFFFANTGDPELFKGMETYDSSDFSDFVMTFDSEDDVTAGGDIPMFGQAINPHTWEEGVPVPLPAPTEYDPWPEYSYPEEWAGCAVVEMEYTVSRLSLTVNWRNVVGTANGDKDFVLKSIQLQSVPRIAPVSLLPFEYDYIRNVFPVIDDSDTDAYGDLFMDYEVITDVENGESYTWYLPPNMQGKGIAFHNERSVVAPPWAAHDPSFGATGVSRATRFVLKGTFGGEEDVTFTVYAVPDSYFDYGGYYQSEDAFDYIYYGTAHLFNVEQTVACNYTVNISGIDLLDHRVEYDGKEPEPLDAPDPRYLGTWNTGMVSWRQVTIDGNSLVYLDNGGHSYTISGLKWTAIENQGSGATADNFRGYKLTGTLTDFKDPDFAYPRYQNYVMTPDSRHSGTSGDGPFYPMIGDEVADYWYMNVKSGRLLHGTFSWPHGTTGVSNSYDFRPYNL